MSRSEKPKPSEIKEVGRQMSTAESAVVKTGDIRVVNLPALTGTEEILEAMAANLDGIRMQFDRIKMPSGGGLTFEIPTEDGKEKPVEFLEGVIIDHFAVNAFWPEKFEGKNSPPQCVALDGQNGRGTPGGSCVGCANNQWGSDGRGRGKACKNLRRIFLLSEGEVFPYMIPLPPTSLKNFEDYMRRLVAKAKKPYYSVITKIGLKKAESVDGIKYSQATFERTALLDAKQAIEIKTYAKKLHNAMHELEVTSDEYNVAEAGDAAGGNGATAKGPDPF